MAEENVDAPTIPKVTRSCRAHLRSQSAGQAIFGNGEGRVCPHYLRASTGSCHDFCKYGRKDELEAKQRSSIPKRDVRKSLHRSSEDAFGRIMISTAKPRASLDLKHSKMPMIKERKSIGSERELARLPSNFQKQIGSKVLISRKETSLQSNSHVSSVPKTRRQEISSTSKVENPLKLISKKKETPLQSNFERVQTYSKSACKKEETQLKSASERVKAHPKPAPKKMETSSKFSSLQGKEMELSDKPVISLNLKSSAMRTTISRSSSEDFGGRTSSDTKTKKNEASSKVASPLKSIKSSIKRMVSINVRKNQGVKFDSPLRDQLKPAEDEPEEYPDEVEEKTLHVIMVEDQSQDLQSDQNVSQEMESSLDSASSLISDSSSKEVREESEQPTIEFDEVSPSRNQVRKCIENQKVSEAKDNQKEEVECYGEDKYCQILEPKVRSGKMFGTQTKKSSSSPKRLNFRRGKELLNKNAKAPEKLVLKHQNLQGKKDGQLFFNNVIEETTSKLVETRQSKVKALVGAFENLISLNQKQKPLAANIVI